MKAIILAGGLGTRMRPMTSERPKPMISLFDRPVLEHILLHLRRNGITEVAVTVHCHPEVMTAAFGDGTEFGMHLTWFQESEPLGTAGSVLACRSFWAEEEAFLVLSGDVVCDFDLNAAARFHREHKAAATILLHRTASPTQYALVMTDDAGKITRFVEKPGWGQVFSSQISTEIYLLTPKAMDAAGEGQVCDFAKELFPTLLERGETLCGYLPYGCWKDIGSCDAYLEAIRDALDGKWKTDLRLPQISAGIWCGSELPQNVTLIPPCYIGEGVTLGSRCVIGPHAVVERGSVVDARAVIQGSALLGASVGTGAALEHAILCPGAAVQAGAVLNRGTVIGSGAVVGRNAILRRGVRVWPETHIAAGARLNTSLTSGTDCGQLLFEEDGTLSATTGLELTPETLVTLGSLLGEDGRVGLGGSGGSAARTLLLAAEAGVTSSGGTAVVHDGTTPGCAAWLAREHALSVSLFLAQSGETVTLHLTDRLGLPLPRPRLRRLENALLRLEVRRASAGHMGHCEHISGTDEAYCTAAIRFSGTGPLKRLHLQVPENTAENRLLAAALSAMGMAVSPTEGSLFLAMAEHRGLLYAADESGRTVTPEQLQLLTLLLMADQGERTFALPPSAPAAAEEAAASCGAQVLRLGRDGAAAETLAAQQSALRDGIFTACFLVHHLSRSGETLEALAGRLPGCVLRTAEVALNSGRGALMEALHQAYPNAEALGSGIRVRMGGGSVYLVPRNRVSALKIAAEAASAEAAEELCAMMRRKTQELDAARQPSR